MSKRVLLLGLAAIAMVVAFNLGVIHARAQAEYSPPQIVTITDPSQLWLKGDHPAVTMKCRIDRTGRVVKVIENSVTAALKPFYEYDAKNKWRFTPAISGADTVACDAVIKLSYVIQSTQVVESFTLVKGDKPKR